MTSKDAAKARIAAAESACDKALKSWSAAVAALGGDVSVNGAGIIHDRLGFEGRLLDAQAKISASLAALRGVEWPTDADYDHC